MFVKSPRKRQTLTLKPYLNDIERCTCSSLLYNELHVNLIKISFIPCLAVDMEAMIRPRAHLIIFIS